MSYPVQLDTHSVACSNFLGFGAEWDSNNYPAAGVTAEDFALIRKRVQWMRLPVARIMMQTKWCYRGPGRYEWDNPAMQALYRHLDVCQELGTTVFLTDWGCEPDWLRIPGIADVADPQYAEAIGGYLDHLLDTLGYSCIRHFILVNEPNLEVRDWPRWRKGVENVWAVMQRRGLDKRLTFTGSDESTNENWHDRAVDELQHVLGAYDMHLYAEDVVVRNGNLYPFFRTLWDYARKNDPRAKDKPCIVGEAGMWDGARPPANNDNIDKVWYGVFMADYAAQAANAGSAAVSAWMLDDNSHQDFTWGLWTDKAAGMKLRPWFQVWGLLCRSFPPGSTIYQVPQPSRSLRLLAAHLPGGGWCFCIVNRAEEPATLTIRVPAAGTVSLQRYVYAEGSLAADDDGFPLPLDATVYDLGKGVSITVPPGAVIFLTSLQDRP
jgi:hypothetical protein